MERAWKKQMDKQMMSMLVNEAVIRALRDAFELKRALRHKLGLKKEFDKPCPICASCLLDLDKMIVTCEHGEFKFPYELTEYCMDDKNWPNDDDSSFSAMFRNLGIIDEEEIKQKVKGRKPPQKRTQRFVTKISWVQDTEQIEQQQPFRRAGFGMG